MILQIAQVGNKILNYSNSHVETGQWTGTSAIHVILIKNCSVEKTIAYSVCFEPGFQVSVTGIYTIQYSDGKNS